MASPLVLSHPGLDRLGRASDAASDLLGRAVAALRGWQGWSRIAAGYAAWSRARIEALALQDPRVRAELQAAAQRDSHDDVR